MKLLRSLVILAGLAMVIGVINLAIAEKETTLKDGRQVLLELRPADPRSLIQGDYMRLRYKEAAFPDKTAMAAMPLRGTLILALGEEGVASFKRRDDGSPLGANEVRMHYKLNAGRGDLRYGAESFFFQEGDAKLYEAARYGVLRVDETGASVLVGLADENRKLIEKRP